MAVDLRWFRPSQTAAGDDVEDCTTTSIHSTQNVNSTPNSTKNAKSAPKSNVDQDSLLRPSLSILRQVKDQISVIESKIRHLHKEYHALFGDSSQPTNAAAVQVITRDIETSTQQLLTDINTLRQELDAASAQHLPLARLKQSIVTEVSSHLKQLHHRLLAVHIRIKHDVMSDYRSKLMPVSSVEPDDEQLAVMARSDDETQLTARLLGSSASQEKLDVLGALDKEHASARSALQCLEHSCALLAQMKTLIQEWGNPQEPPAGTKSAPPQGVRGRPATVSEQLLIQRVMAWLRVANHALMVVAVLGLIAAVVIIIIFAI